LDSTVGLLTLCVSFLIFRARGGGFKVIVMLSEVQAYDGITQGQGFKASPYRVRRLPGCFGRESQSGRPPVCLLSGDHKLKPNSSPFAKVDHCWVFESNNSNSVAASENAVHISKDCRTLYIRQKAKRGEIQPYMKTQNGERDVDLSTSLAAMLKDFIGTRSSGLLFRTSSGRQILQTDILRDSLHPILKKLEHVKGGFNIFRCFCITELKKSDCPDTLQHFWSGQAPTHVSERYTKLLQDRDYRLEWAEKTGMGFELPAVSVAPRAPLHQFSRT